MFGVGAITQNKTDDGLSDSHRKFQSPKTQKSRRTIPLGPRAIAWLREHRLRVKRTAADDLVFGNRTAQPCGNRSYFRRSYSRPRKPPGSVE
jgi:hypothetical protein